MDARLLETYLTNVLRVYDDAYETITELHPVKRGVHNEVTLEPLYIVPVWNPEGRPTSVGANIAYRERAENHALGAGGWFTVGAAHAANLAWAEEVLAVSVADDYAAATLARQVGQPACWHWTGDDLRVLSSDDGGQLGATPASVRQLSHRPCPMQPADPTSRERCVRPGGPWVSRSREMAASFDRDRAALVSVVGCDVCHGGQARGAPGGPILLHEWSAASRYGAAKILRPASDLD